ncbi:hypothetical protein [Ralstonia pickettii]|uniref:Transmembrane protein n=1 Tax=Ralstonia pickettii TaxID=329 RepID=A0A9Q3LKQ7_RALPI|nr:hypothetical protein [Ralstonia pickettii]MBA9844671.1 hypothetical protein [Ralstonia pickettii]MBA9849358.1 hypothetical protein [Ralstonia pickettii]MBA9876042.1 hypothetical protein [Ralstonia pickettii]MBA9881350.1 hypothetical protein [Ralstonia pickettii]MBA9885925.1 hypothetical protein [Ralstonia pickettii]
MSHMQPHSTHRTPAPRAHRDPAAHRATRHAGPSHLGGSSSAEPEMAGAQAVFYIARGVAALLAAVAVGLGAASDKAEQPSTPYPSSSQATAR